MRQKLAEHLKAMVGSILKTAINLNKCKKEGYAVVVTLPFGQDSSAKKKNCVVENCVKGKLMLLPPEYQFHKLTLTNIVTMRYCNDHVQQISPYSY